MTESPFRRVVDRLADLALLALLIAVTSLPLVTGFTALTAAAAVLGEQDDERPVPGRFIRALRRRPGAAISVQLLVLAVLGVALVDLVFADGTAAGPAVRAAVGGLGILLLLGVATVPPYAAVLAARRSPGGPSRPGGLILVGAALAIARPLTSAAALGSTACLTAWCWAMPALTPLLLGLAAVVSLTLAHRAVRHVRTSQLLLALTPTEELP